MDSRWDLLAIKPDDDVAVALRASPAGTTLDSKPTYA